MRIVFLTDYFYPYVHGGAETSILELAKALVENRNDVFVLTPNYGAVARESISEVTVVRYNFLVKLASFSSQLSPVWQFNPYYWLISVTEILKLVAREKIDIIHCQGMHTILPGVIAGKILRKPVVVTFRDSQILCNYGLCLTNDQFGKTCSLTDYFAKDFINYYAAKVNSRNLGTFGIQVLFAIFGRFRIKVLQIFARMCDLQIVNSFPQQKTFLANGFKNTQVVSNVFHFPQKIGLPVKTGNYLLYATKLSSGKGLDVLLLAFSKVVEKNPALRMLVVGGGDIEKYQKLSRRLKIGKFVEFKGRVEHNVVMKLRTKALLELAPSVYPESFGRTALEALASGVPVVASNRGGLTDIVDHGVTGYVCEPTTDKLAANILLGIKNNRGLRKNIRKEYSKLREKFEVYPVRKQVELYRKLL